MRSVLPLLLLTAALGACSPAPDDAAGGGLNQAEAEQLDRAAARIDARPPSPGADAAARHEAEVEARLAAEPKPR